MQRTRPPKPRPTARQTLVPLAAFILAVGLSPWANAANIYWVGGNGSFGNATNWSPNAVPGPTSTVWINGGAFYDFATYDLVIGNRSRLQLAGAARAIVDGTATIGIDGFIVGNGVMQFDGNGVTLRNEGRLTTGVGGMSLYQNGPGHFDLDGSDAATHWDIHNSISVMTERIDSTFNNSFEGSMHIGGGLAGRLNVQLIGAEDTWQMNGSMTLDGLGVSPITRVQGSRMLVSGDLKVINKAAVSAPVVLTSSSLVTLADPSALPVTHLWTTAGLYASNDGGIPPEKGVAFNAFEGNENTDDPFAEATLRQEILGVAGGDYFLSFDYKITEYFNALWTVTLDSDMNPGLPVVYDIAPNGNRDNDWHAAQRQLNGLSAGASILVEVKMLNGEYSVGIPYPADQLHRQLRAHAGARAIVLRAAGPGRTDLCTPPSLGSIVAIYP